MDTAPDATFATGALLCTITFDAGFAAVDFLDICIKPSFTKNS
jgi:hypothetical protein